MQPKITQILPRQGQLVSRQLKRVAAYARVSSGKDAMLHSLSAQVSHYSELIQKRRDWQYVGVYADEAISGTKDSRVQFQKLLDDCRAGKIDMIITKAISRFARNTVTMLEVVRELKTLGVDVYFERENIHSLSGDGELMLSILSSFAQEESRSVSENCKWRIRKGFELGKHHGITKLFGYRIEHGEFTIIPDEAEIVRQIFADYLSGMGREALHKKLRQQGIELSLTGIYKLLRNEKYIGDLCLQKSFIVDHLTKKKQQNNGEKPMFYVEDNHEPIIDRDTFEKVQHELQRRSAKHHPMPKTPKTYPFTGKITCSICGDKYRRKINSAKPVWICSGYNTYGKAYCASKQIPEKILLELAGDDFESIRVPTPGLIIVVMPDGTVIEKQWQNKSRRKNWMEEIL